MSKDTQGNAGRAQSAANFASQHPGEQPSNYYSNGDDYQNMQSGWMTCLTLPGGVLVLAAVVLLVVLL
jgi:hypothetical protein